jgi:hypothetical protein
MADEVEPAGTEALQFERIAQLDRELGDIARDGFRRADRFSESLADFDQLRGADGLDRFAEAADGLVDAPSEFGPEAQRKRCAGLRQQIADVVKPKDAQTVDKISRSRILRWYRLRGRISWMSGTTT